MRRGGNRRASLSASARPVAVLPHKIAAPDVGRADAPLAPRGGAAMKIPMINLCPMLAATEAGWRANLDRLFDRMQFILGEQVAAFERELAAAFGARHAVAVGS